MTKEEKVQKVVEEFLGKNYGETVEHFMLAALIEEKAGTHEYWSIINRASKKLLDCGKMIENIKGVGYRIVAPDDYTKQTARCLKQASNRVNKGNDILKNAPVRDMSMDGVQTYNQVADRMKILQAAVAGAKVEINMLSSKRQNPLALMPERSQNQRADKGVRYH